MDQLNRDWIKKESNKHKGKYYYFNKKTGESLWDPAERVDKNSTNNETFGSNVKVKPKLSCSAKLMKVKKSSGVNKKRTPAQDRLQKLQTNLLLEHSKNAKPSQKPDKKKVFSVAIDPTVITASKCTDLSKTENDNVKNYEIIEPQEINKSKATNLSHSKNGKVGTDESSKFIHPPNKRRVPQNTSILSKIPRLIADALCSIPKLIKNSPKATQDRLKLEEKNLSTIVPGKESELVTSKVFCSGNCEPLVNNNSGLNSALNFSKIKKLQGSSINQDKSKNRRSNRPQTAIDRCLPLQKKRGTANERLQNLRNLLNFQTNTLDSIKTNVCCENAASSSLNHSPIVSSEYTPMEWESIEEQIDEKITEIRKEHHSNQSDEGVLGDLYNIVNHNLLKIAAEKTQNALIKGNQFHLIVDTNVFLRNLTFIEDLRKMTFSGTDSSAIIIPYCVLQELDRIKHRSSTSVSTLAVRAIKYLNEKFESKDDSVRGQNAIEAKRNLITIENADDSILNCCLQIKEKTSKLLLLTNDVNLRNKAICNSIPVSTKSELETVRCDLT